MEKDLNRQKNLDSKIDNAIFEAEEELKNGAKPISIEEAHKRLEKKFFTQTDKQ